MTRISLISPLDIKYSYKGTEYHVYEYAKCLVENGIDAELLITGASGYHPSIKNYKRISAEYSMIPHRKIPCSEILLPFKWHHFMCRNLPKESIIYLPFGPYQYLFNIATKPRGQKYIIGCLAMELKFGNLIEGNDALEIIAKVAIRIALSKGADTRNYYFHAINKAQVEYLVGLGVKKDRINYVPLMLDTSKYHISNNKARKLRVIHVGGTGKASAMVAQVIEALSEESQMDKFEFYFMWSNQPEEVRKCAATYENVHLLGSPSEERKAKILSAMDVMIIPSTEAFSKTMLEGIASGLHIVVSKRNPASLDVRALGVNMTITERSEPSEYIEELVKLANLKIKLGSKFNKSKRRYREIVVENFDRIQVLPKIFEMFMKIMNE
ncbi:MAG: glycosyltransferase [Candidatus Marsarchaeota archaeon]|jgi:glycosyltransferase involved in cell wall biosynthesis|nr:glycosyltransferase [Candidatus Marsarchaeota archaeon]MCL5111258.1 glycosyltransferase [Candidatus Marsarchaeota archaeon]